MRNQCIISVIVPVYNVEKYLDRCIQSIINQSFSNIEIILVDDGSTDNSGIICDNYKALDQRITVIHKENGGLSDARNCGLDIAKGDFIGFVDSDDWLDLDYYSTLYEIAIKDNSDVVSCLYTRTSGNESLNDCRECESSVLCGDEGQIVFLESAIKGGVTWVPCWSKIYKRSIIQNARFRKGKIYEDVIFNWEILNMDIKMSCTSYSGYYYFVNQNSITKSKFSEKMFDLYYIADEMQKMYNGSSSNVLNLLKQYRAKVDYSVFARIVRTHYGDKELATKTLEKTRANFGLLIKSPLSKTRKMALIGIMLVPKWLWLRII